MAKRFWDSTWGRFPYSEYTIWQGVIRRGCNPRDPAYASYGARGITVCERWRDDFMMFLADMGPRPSLAYTIDRLDNARGYEPDNCRWATRSQQQRNKRRPPARGTHYVPRANRWRARINIHGRAVSLGTFKTEAEAVAAYRGARASAAIINSIVLDATSPPAVTDGSPARLRAPGRRGDVA